MTTVGTHEQGGPRTQLDNKFNETDFFKALENKRSDQFTYWHFITQLNNTLQICMQVYPKHLCLLRAKT